MAAKKPTPAVETVTVTVTVAGSYDRQSDAWIFRTVDEDYEPTEFEVTSSVNIEIEV